MDREFLDKSREAATAMGDFIHLSPSPFHAVSNCKKMLTESGFLELCPKSSWHSVLKNCSKYFVIINSSMLIAFSVGKMFKPKNGITMIATHTDSPALKVKPVSTRTKSGYQMLSVQPYGGGLWDSWFDRNLKLAGRVMFNNNGKIQQKLVDFSRSILTIPRLAIHLNRQVNTDGFKFNLEDHCLPIIATDYINNIINADSKNTVADTNSQHPPYLLQEISEICKKSPQDLLDLELYLADTQEPCLTGFHQELISSPRLDNLFNTYTAIAALCESVMLEDFENDYSMRMVCCFDNEEVGSTSYQGADSQTVANLIKRILKEFADSNVDDQFELCMENSILISADQAHALHPNYAEKHDINHQVKLHGGVVIKNNANQRYSTNAFTSTIIKQVCRVNDLPYQEYVVRNDSACGSTIGPLLSSILGIKTVDIGFPMLAMHSIREVCCVSSVLQAIELYKALYRSVPHMLKTHQDYLQ